SIYLYRTIVELLVKAVPPRFGGYPQFKGGIAMRLARLSTLLAAALAFATLPAFAQLGIRLGGQSQTQGQAQRNGGTSNLGLGSTNTTGANVSGRHGSADLGSDSSLNSDMSSNGGLMTQAEAAQQTSAQATANARKRGAKASSDVSSTAGSTL